MLRIANGVKQSDVADAIGVSQQTYSLYEKGTAAVDSERIIRICRYYGVTADYLLGINNRPVADAEYQAASLTIPIPAQSTEENG